MAVPTVTRAELRRAIGLELEMPFFMRYTDGYLTCDSTSTASKVQDSELTQPPSFWKNSWFYISDTSDTGLDGSIRLVDDFASDSDILFLEYDLSSAPDNLEYELHSGFNANQIHNAINRAIETSFPAFFDVVQDSTLVYQEDKLTYDISGLTYAPYIISKVEIERPWNTITGTATSGDVAYLIDTGADFSDVNTNYKISIYDGTGAGQVRSVGSVTGTTQINPSVNFDTAPDSTSKYAVWDATEEELIWYRVLDCKFDRNEYPDTLYLGNSNWSDVYGGRIRLTYATKPSALTTDSATTVVPKEYIIAKAIELLSASKIGNHRSNTRKYQYKEQLYKERAEDFKALNSTTMNTTLWQEYDAGQPRTYTDIDPLGFRS